MFQGEGDEMTEYTVLSSYPFTTQRLDAVEVDEGLQIT